MASNRNCFQIFRRYLLLGPTSLVLLSIFLISGIARAQIVKSTFVGTIRDASGAVVPGATVTIKNLETGVTKTVPTDGTGSYIVPFLNSGMYSVTAEKSGFQTAVESGIKLDVAATIRVDITLQLGQTTQRIEVHAASPLVETDTSTVDTVLTTERLRQLPLLGRNYQELTQLAPTAIGVVPNAATGYIGGLTTGNYYQLAGQRGAYISYTVDGIVDNNFLMQTQSLIPSLDSIGEFKVETHNFAAEYGIGTVEYVAATRAGTNRLHGSAYEFVRNDALDARDFFLNEFGGKKQEYRYNQFGGTVGGPIVLPKVYNGKDKTFFFFAYEGTRYVTKNTAYARWPMPEWLTGDFSTLTNPDGSPKIIYDPTTGHLNDQGQYVRDPFQNNKIPTDRLDSVALAAAQFIPTPQQRADLPGLEGMANTSGRVFTDSSPNYWNLRVDHNISDKDQIYARYMQSNEFTPSSSLSPLSGSFITNRGKNGMFSETHMFGPTLVNELRLGYNRSNYGNMQEGADGICITPCKAVNYDALFGLKNVGGGPLTWGLPAFGFSNYTGFGGPVDSPFRPLTNTFQISDNLIISKGRHSMKAGVDLRKSRFNMIWGTFNRGGIYFNGQYTSSGSAGVDGQDIADMMLGLPYDLRGAAGEISGISHGNTYAFYFQDDYRVTSKLTLNLGLRWEDYTPWNDQEGHLSVFVEGFPPGQCFGDNCAPGHVEVIPKNAPLYDNNLGDWAPRIGFSYAPFGNKKTVIRASYGIFYTPPDIDDVVASYFNPPNALAFEIETPYTDYTTPKLSNQFPAATIPPVSQLVTNNWPLPQIAMFTTDKRTPDAAVNEWQITVQRELAPDLLLELGYIGSHGYHGQLRINHAQARLDYPGQTTPLASREPYPSLGSIMYAVEHEAVNSYNAGTVRLEKRFSHGLSLLGAFTWAKTLDNYGNLNDSTGFWAQNGYDLKAEYGLTSFDTPYRFSSGYVYELPYGRGRRFGSGINSILDGVVGGWQVSGITTFQSGTPIVPRPYYDVSNTGTYSFTDRMNQVAPVTYLDIRKTGHFFNPDAFALPPFGTFGTAARGDLMGPGLNNWDLGISKYFRIKERARLQFRMESFNAWNHAQFSEDATWGGGNITYSPEALAAGTVGKVLATTGPRSVQLGLRLEF